MAIGESIAGDVGCVSWQQEVDAAASLSMTEALPRMSGAAALLLRVARVDQSEDAAAAARWLGRYGPLAAAVGAMVRSVEGGA
ncbi:hypothetical protein ACSFBF_03230 [Variovorax sp. ZT5P49]|uniref:hypothetical protein n=1 Tax=Variovorax sp. ZT5P49 TaxID=3443733 RepID=UPI003F46A0A4